MTGTFKQFYQNNPWKGRLLIALLVFIIALTAARLALPKIIIMSATSWLQEQGIESSIQDININLLDGTVSLINASGKQDGKDLFKVELVNIHWLWKPLSEKTAEVTRVDLQGIKVDIKHYTDSIIIGGVSIPLGTTDSSKPEKDNKADQADDVKPWAAAIGKVNFREIDICYAQHQASQAEASNDNLFVDYCASLEEMSWGGTISYGMDQVLLEKNDFPINTTGDFSLNAFTLTDNRLGRHLLVADAETISQVEINGLNDIRVDTYELHGLSVMQRDDTKHVDSVRLNQLLVKEISLTNLSSLSISSVKLEAPGLYIEKDKQARFEYETWIPVSKSVATTSEKTDNATASSKPFSIKLKNLSITKADLCHNDKSKLQYYCFTSDMFSFSGDTEINTPVRQEAVSIKISSDLDIHNLIIRNHSIKRNLLTLDDLNINGININSIEKAKFKQLVLKQLRALQRSDENSDYTAQFDSLDISGFSYSPQRTETDSIELLGLASHVSINKDGQLEHQKWLPPSLRKDKHKDSNKTTTQVDTATDSDKTSSAKTDSRLQLALGQLKLDTNKKQIFTDNSTVPPMEVGLDKLLLEISKLDSSTPDTDSPVKLSAKTTRHSTIDLEGTARPLADKISFDTTGKLKGFDLRAFSPATRKAIGHTIKSGQMDADLKLLAKEGILDSNIALSLYQFNIKSMSKKDAEKLDKAFGMPLNQTLVLLRDKDGSIHLDIPITGDVNNPNFDPMDAIIKATSKAATVTLVTFYTPYGLIYAGGNVLFDLATAMNFDPVEFEPGKTELNNKGKEQLQNLNKLLTEKPQIHLTLCGVTNGQDTIALYSDLKDKKPGSSSDVKLTDKQEMALIQLAKDRQVTTKNYLINEMGIEHSRLILCAPEHSQDKDAISGVEITI